MIVPRAPDAQDGRRSTSDLRACASEAGLSSSSPSDMYRRRDTTDLLAK